MTKSLKPLHVYKRIHVIPGELCIKQCIHCGVTRLGVKGTTTYFIKGEEVSGIGKRRIPPCPGDEIAQLQATVINQRNSHANVVLDLHKGYIRKIAEAAGRTQQKIPPKTPDQLIIQFKSGHQIRSKGSPKEDLINECVEKHGEIVAYFAIIKKKK